MILSCGLIQIFNVVSWSSCGMFSTIPALSNDVMLRGHPGLLWTEGKQLCFALPHSEKRRLFKTFYNQLSLADRALWWLWMEAV